MILTEVVSNIGVILGNFHLTYMWTEGINSLPHGVVGRSQQKDAQPSAGTNPLQAVEE